MGSLCYLQTKICSMVFFLAGPFEAPIVECVFDMLITDTSLKLSRTNSSTLAPATLSIPSDGYDNTSGIPRSHTPEKRRSNAPMTSVFFENGDAYLLSLYLPIPVDIGKSYK